MGNIVRSLKNLLAVLTFIAIAGRTANAQEDAGAAIKHLQFLAGTWTCSFQTANGPASQDVTYEFSPDGLWMTESSKPSSTGGDDWGMQVWGYDRHSGKFVAYNFGANGVYTKTVDGWSNGEFRSHRDDNGLTVVLKPGGPTTMKWLVENTEGTLLASETCTKAK